MALIKYAYVYIMYILYYSMFLFPYFWDIKLVKMDIIWTNFELVIV